MAKAIIIDRGWLKIKADCMQLRGQGVKVGLRSGPMNNGVAVVDYATFNEFGTQDIPSRPFMRRTADLSQRDLRAFAKFLTQRLLTRNLNVDGVMNSLGLWYKTRIQQTIRSARAWAAPNSKATITTKGSSAPLIDDAIMINSVDYQRTRIK